MKEKEELSDTLERSSFRGDMLQERLTNVLEETDDTKNAAIIAFFVTLITFVIFAITSGDGLLGEIQYMIGGY